MQNQPDAGGLEALGVQGAAPRLRPEVVLLPALDPPEVRGHPRADLSSPLYPPAIRITGRLTEHGPRPRNLPITGTRGIVFLLFFLSPLRKQPRHVH